jgi:glutamine synthetase
MTAARLTIDEAQAFLDANPGVQWIDAFLFDMNGIPRGKRLRRADLIGVAKGGLMMPSSVFIMDPLGNCVEETGRLWETGDHDHHCHLLSGTLVPIPLGDRLHDDRRQGRTRPAHGAHRTGRALHPRRANAGRGRRA